MTWVTTVSPAKWRFHPTMSYLTPPLGSFGEKKTADKTRPLDLQLEAFVPPHRGEKGAVHRKKRKKIKNSSTAYKKLKWQVMLFAVDTSGCFGELWVLVP
jgi:hypothetical protein